MQLPPLFLRGEPRNGHVGFTLQNIPVIDTRFLGYVFHAAWMTPERLTVRLQAPGVSVNAAQPVSPRQGSSDPVYAALRSVKKTLDRELVDANIRIVPKASGTALWVIEVETSNARDIGLLTAAIGYDLSDARIGATVLPAVGKYQNVIAVILENFGELTAEAPASS